jgi:hypothetical protein
MGASLNKVPTATGLVSRIKSLFTSLPRSPIPIDPSTYTTPDGQSGWLFEMFGGGGYSYFKYENYDSCVQAYALCPPVTAIINRKCNCLVNGKTWVLDAKNKVAKGPQAEQIYRIINQPNPIQSWRDFEAQTYSYFQLFGFALILPIQPAGFEKNRLETSSMWNIPINWIDVDATVERFNNNGGVTITEIVVAYNGNKLVFELKKLIMIRDFMPSFQQGTSITFPGSKIKALALPINNVIGAYESRNVLINYRGALGILSGDPGSSQYTPVPLTPEQKVQLQQDFRRYGLKKQQLQVILTSASLKWQQMGYATKDLMLMEEVVDSTKAICANLNFPPFILGIADTTFNNMNAAEKALYQNSVIPDSNIIYEQLTKWFGLEEFGLRLDKDFAHIAVLQDDALALAQARSALSGSLNLEWRNDWLTLNRVLELMGEDTIGTDGDIYYSEWVKKITTDPEITDEEVKIFLITQSRHSNGQFGGMVGTYNAVTPGGVDLSKQLNNGTH